MFRIVGWLVVTGFALYGVNTFVKNHVVADKGNTPPKGDTTSKVAKPYAFS